MCCRPADLAKYQEPDEDLVDLADAGPAPLAKERQPVAEPAPLPEEQQQVAEPRRVDAEAGLRRASND